MSARFTLRQHLGALVHDVPRTLLALRPWGDRAGHAPWLFVRNRAERLHVEPRGLGVRCDWRWTSDLHAAHVYPLLGRALLRRALRDWPIGFAPAPARHADVPEIAFAIGQRGLARLPLLLAVLRSIAAQEHAQVECIVVEQAPQVEIAAALPPWVRHVHTPVPATLPYARSWAFNVAARQARASVLVFHDGDILVPRGYAQAVLRRVRAGAEFVDLKRLLFELSAEQNATALAGRPDAVRGALERVRQNARGGTLAADKRAFFDIGGFDEAFVGWGGEDNEFWERALTRRAEAFGLLPFVHLWHAAQPGKQVPAAPTRALYDELSQVPALERCARLRARDFGNPRGPVPSPRHTPSPGAR
jgi:hypothetical protein